MDLLEDILDFFKDNKADFTYRIIDGTGGYFQNVKSILSFDEKLVVLKFKACSLEISGSFLKVLKYDDGDVAISGKIEKIVKVSK